MIRLTPLLYFLHLHPIQTIAKTITIIADIMRVFVAFILEEGKSQHTMELCEDWETHDKHRAHT